jgi:hypothetical protein
MRRARCPASAPRVAAPAPSDDAPSALFPPFVPRTIAALLTLASLGCKHAAPVAPPPRPVLGAIVVRDLTPAEDAPAHVDVAAIGDALRGRLLATDQFEDADGGTRDRAVTHLDVQLGLDGAEIEARGVARARLALHLVTRPEDAPGAIDERLEGAGEQPYVVRAHMDKGALFAALVERVAGDLLDGLTTRRRLARASAEALHAAMVADGGVLRLEAIRVIRERRLSSEAPTLLTLLDDPDEPTRDAALGALIALGDRRAVTALTRSRSLRDRHEMSKIIQAISILGGDEADDYLSFIASSHDDEEIRAEAKAARERLQRRRGDAAVNPP